MVPTKTARSDRTIPEAPSVVRALAKEEHSVGLLKVGYNMPIHRV